MLTKYNELIVFSTMASSTNNTKFNEANLAVLRGLIQNGTVDNMTTASIQEQWSQFFGHIKKSSFSSRLSRLRGELGKTRGRQSKRKRYVLINLYTFRVLTVPKFLRKVQKL